MGKPVDPKTKKIKVRAAEYVCESCGVVEEKQAHEKKLSVMIIYECPFCKHKGETTVPFARKSWYGKKAVVFSCAGCSEKLGVTKKLSTPPDFVAKVQGKPIRKSKDVVDDDDDDDF